jgi:UDP-glucose 4-epimerase
LGKNRILVTGGAGFIGSHIVDKLLSKDFEVTVFDDLSNGRLENIPHLDNELFHFIKGDILDLDTVKQIVKNHDVIFHEAAITDISFSVNNPIITNEINVKGTLCLLKACLDSDVKRFIFASSASVYGKPNILPMREDMSLNPESPYAVSKLAAENYIKFFHDIYGLETIILRYMNVYGPRAMENQGVISIFINRLLKNKSPVIYGDGEETRDFINVQEVADANILAVSSKKAVGEIINIGSGIPTSIHQIANFVQEATNKKHIKLIYSDPRLGDMRHAYADIKKARELLDFNPKIPLKEGITQLVKWFEDKPRRARKNI